MYAFVVWDPICHETAAAQTVRCVEGHITPASTETAPPSHPGSRLSPVGSSTDRSHLALVDLHTCRLPTVESVTTSRRTKDHRHLSVSNLHVKVGHPLPPVRVCLRNLYLMNMLNIL